MEVAYALLIQRERAGLVRSPSAALTPVTAADHPGIRVLRIFGEWAGAFPGADEMQGVTPGNDSNGQPCRGAYCLTAS